MDMGPMFGSKEKLLLILSFIGISPTDYQRSVKKSPRIPYDAQKTPTQGLLKSPPLPRRTTLVLKAAPLTDPGQGQQRKKRGNAGKRPKAIDFF